MTQTVIGVFNSTDDAYDVKETSEKTKTVKDTARHTEVNVEKEPGKGSSGKQGK